MSIARGSTLQNVARVFVTRKSLLLFLCPVIFAAGCRSMTHAKAKAEALDRWNHVRGRVKLQLAQQAFKGGNFEDAVLTATESISLDPKMPDAYALLVRADLELGKPKSASAVLDAARQVGQTSPALHYLRGVILEQRNELEEAVKEYVQASSLDGENVDYLVAEAECLVALQRPAEALERLEENRDRFDEESTMAVLAAHISTFLGDSAKALKYYGQAYDIDSKDRLIAEEFGRLLFESRRYNEALHVLEPLLASTPEGQAAGSVRRAVASCHLALGHAKAAKRVLLSYAQANPNDAPAQLLLAKTAIATNDWITALRAIDLAQAQDPDRITLKLARATVEWKRGRYADAEKDLNDLLKDNPNDVDAHCLLAEVLEGQKQFDAARSRFQKALRIDPHCTWALRGLQTLQVAQ